MKLQDWHQELAVLIDEVCTQENQVLTRPPAETDEGRHGTAPQCLCLLPLCLCPLLLCLSAFTSAAVPQSVPLSTAAAAVRLSTAAAAETDKGRHGAVPALQLTLCHMHTL